MSPPHWTTHSTKLMVSGVRRELCMYSQGGAKEEDRKGPAKNRRNRTQIPIGLLPRIAVIGRPNVGKSALFNRLSGTAAAIVYDTPGVTRDRLYVRGFWGTDEFLLIDTGGLIKPSRLASAGIAPELPDHVRRSSPPSPGGWELYGCMSVCVDACTMHEVDEKGGLARMRNRGGLVSDSSPVIV